MNYQSVSDAVARLFVHFCLEASSKSRPRDAAHGRTQAENLIHNERILLRQDYIKLRLSLGGKTYRVMAGDIHACKRPTIDVWEESRVLAGDYDPLWEYMNVEQFGSFLRDPVRYDMYAEYV